MLQENITNTYKGHPSNYIYFITVGSMLQEDFNHKLQSFIHEPFG